jgi:AraC family transcriptional regulator
MTASAFSLRIASAFNVENAPVVLARTARKAELALIDLKGNSDHPFRTATLPDDDAFLVTLNLKDNTCHQMWEDGKPTPISNLMAGQTTIQDLTRRPEYLVDKPFHFQSLYIPRSAFDEVADAADAPRISDLAYRPGVGVHDDIIANLIGVLSRAFNEPSSVDQLFLDHIGLAIVAHIGLAFGGLFMEGNPLKGGLAPWQKKRATEMLEARLATGIAIGELALECDLSHRHFCRAFRQSLGASPHAYMQTIRIEKAKLLLHATRSSLADIGSECGFADQSHFTRVFTQFEGVAPGVWRRARDRSGEARRSWPSIGATHPLC